MAGSTEGRIGFLDGIRVMACLMVVMVHSCEFFYIDGSSVGFRSPDDGWWVCVIDSAFRCSVPLFVMVSSYLLVPVKDSVGRFFRKRLVRVGVPFVIWSLLYATLPYLWGAMSGQEVRESLLRLSYNFNYASGHLWFIYMLVGLYLFMPVISPWLEKVGKKAEQWFLALWFVSTFFPYLRACCGELLGECPWNEYNTLWYFSGYMGYVVLAHYIRHHLAWSVKKQLVVGLLLYAVGYYITAAVWYDRIPTTTDVQELELSWRFCTPNVAMTSFGAFIVFQALFRKAASSRLITDVSQLSYGIYLVHIFILNVAYQLLDGMFSTPLTILLMGVSTFVVSYILVKLLSYLPKGKYIVG